MRVEAYHDVAVKSEDLAKATDRIETQLVYIAEAMHGQVHMTKLLVDAIHDLTNKLG